MTIYNLITYLRQNPQEFTKRQNCFIYLSHTYGRALPAIMFNNHAIYGYYDPLLPGKWCVAIVTKRDYSYMDLLIPQIGGTYNAAERR